MWGGVNGSSVRVRARGKADLGCEYVGWS